MCPHAVAVRADSLDGSCHEVFDKDVVVFVRIAGYEIACLALEGHIPAVGVDGGVLRAARRPPLGIGIREDELARQEIRDEDVRVAVGVAGYQIAGRTGKDDITAVARWRGSPNSWSAC